MLSDQKVSEELRLMGRLQEVRLTQDVAREACQRAGGKAFLMGFISSLGTHYVIGLKALNCNTGEWRRTAGSTCSRSWTSRLPRCEKSWVSRWPRSKSTTRPWKEQRRPLRL